nr:uncharacterized protein LOC123284738 [Equus asinus]
MQQRGLLSTYYVPGDWDTSVKKTTNALVLTGEGVRLGFKISQCAKMTHPPTSCCVKSASYTNHRAGELRLSLFWLRLNSGCLQMKTHTGPHGTLVTSCWLETPLLPPQSHQTHLPKGNIRSSPASCSKLLRTRHHRNEIKCDSRSSLRAWPTQLASKGQRDYKTVDSWTKTRMKVMLVVMLKKKISEWLDEFLHWPLHQLRSAASCFCCKPARS